MINKKMYMRLSKFAIVTMIASSLNVAVYAKDGDLWKANSNLGGIDNVLLHNHPAIFDLIKNTSTYGYEISNKLYNADQVNKLFIANPTETRAEIQSSVLSTLISTASVPVTTANVSTSNELNIALANNSITTINLTASFAASPTVIRPLTMNFGAYTLTGNLSFNYTGAGTSILTGDAGNRITGNLTVNTPKASFKNGVKVSGEVSVVNVEIGTWTESADGNNVYIYDQDGAVITVTGDPSSVTIVTSASGSLTLTVNPGATVTRINSNAHADIVVAAGATVTNITAAAGSSGTSITNNGTIGTITADVPINLVANVAPGTVTGASGNVIVSGTSGSSVVVVTPVVNPPYYPPYNPPTNVVVSTISVTPLTMTLTVGGATGTVEANVEPSNATNKSVTWSSSNTNVATVVGGVITPKAAGTANIIVTSIADGTKTATCEVTVKAAATLLLLSQMTTSTVAGVGDKIAFTGLADGDVVKIYDEVAGGNEVAGALGSTTSGAAEFTFTSDLGTGAKDVWVTITSIGKTESARVKVTMAAEPAESLTAISATEGAAQGTTIVSINETVGDGNSLVFKVGDTNVIGLTVEYTVTGSTPFESGITEIPVVANQYVTVYEINESNQVVRYVSERIVTAQIQYFKFETGTIKGYDIAGGPNVVIPSMIGGVAVTKIGNSAFVGKDITSVSIPNSVTSIAIQVFYACTKLEQIIVDGNNAIYSDSDGVLFSKDKKTLLTYPDGKIGNYTITEGVTSIDNIAFGGWNKLENIMVDEKNTHFSSDGGVLFTIDKKTLLRCPNLKIGSYTIPNSVESIGYGAFFGCRGLTNVIIQEGVVSIGVAAFNGCRGLTEVAIPASVTDISYYAFYNCDGLERIIVDGENKTYSSDDGVLFTKDKYTLLLFPYGKKGSYIIPDGVKTIGYRAFFLSSRELTSITIPNTVTSIDQYAFESRQLLSAYFYGNAPNFNGAYLSFTVYYISDKEGFNDITNKETFVPVTAINDISGTPKAGVELTTGTLIPTGAVAAATYQWQICATENGAYENITGATTNKYTPVLEDVGKFIKVVAIGTGGYHGTVTSVAVAVAPIAPVPVVPVVPTAKVSAVSFTDADTDTDQMGGTLTWTAPSDVSNVTSYVVYASINGTTKGSKIGTDVPVGTNQLVIADNTTFSKYIIVVAKNAVGEAISDNYASTTVVDVVSVTVVTAPVVNAANVASVTVTGNTTNTTDVGTIIVKLSDGTNSVTGTVYKATGSTEFTVTGIDASALNDGVALTVTASLTNAEGVISNVYTGTSFVKDVVVAKVDLVGLAASAYQSGELVDGEVVSIIFSEILDITAKADLITELESVFNSVKGSSGWAHASYKSKVNGSIIIDDTLGVSTVTIKAANGVAINITSLGTSGVFTITAANATDVAGNVPSADLTVPLINE